MSLFVLNDQFFEVVGVTDALTGAAITDATVQLTVRDPNGDPVTGLNNVNVPSIGGGDYRLKFENTLPLAVSAYIGHVTITKDSTDAYFQVSMPAIDRTASI